MTHQEDNRSIAVGLIWLGAGLAIGLTNINSGDINVFNMLISLFVSVGALSSTVALLRAAEVFKAKRELSTSDDYSNLLVHLMTEDERRALRSRLINNVADDGEILNAKEVSSEKAHSASS
jgi:hypothetical protein